MEHPAGRSNRRSVVLVGRLPLEIAQSLAAQGTQRPRIGAGNPRVVTAPHAVSRNRNELTIHVLDALVMRGTGYHETILSGTADRVVLKGQPRAFPFDVSLARLDDRRGLGGGPVEPIEPD